MVELWGPSLGWSHVVVSYRPWSLGSALHHFPLGRAMGPFFGLVPRGRQLSALAPWSLGSALHHLSHGRAMGPFSGLVPRGCRLSALATWSLGLALHHLPLGRAMRPFFGLVPRGHQLSALVSRVGLASSSSWQSYGAVLWTGPTWSSAIGLGL